MSTPSQTPSLTPSRSSSPDYPTQPDHFYGSNFVDLTGSPGSNGKLWLDPADDPLAHRGIPVFKPTMAEFEDFEAYVSSIECWGSRSGIVKIIPPQEWKDALPPLSEQLPSVKIKSPIEQHMLGRGGLFRQENVEKRRLMSVREWSELCAKEEFKAPSKDDFKDRSNANPNGRITRSKKNAKVEAEDVRIKSEPMEDDHAITVDQPTIPSPEDSTPGPISTTPAPDAKEEQKQKKGREANLAERANRDQEFMKTFDPHTHWLPRNTTPSDYTPEFCQKLERLYWRTCGFGKPAWYGADCAGSLFTDDVTSWNVAHLPSALSRLLPESNLGLPGVNTPYLYFGMWRATFAWHVEDMDLFSINYIHFGAPKFWYSVPQGRASALEQTMRGYFPSDTSHCDQFLRHKSFLASPSLLAQSSCRPNILVQHSQEIVITFPRGYHAGFNLGLNCAESVNFALESWIALGLKARACKCVSDSVVIDVQQLLDDRKRERGEAFIEPPDLQPALPKSHKKESPRTSKKRKAPAPPSAPRPKKPKLKASSSPSSKPTGTTLAPSSPQARPKITLTLKLGPRPAEPEPFPCCLCVSMSKEDLLPVQDPPLNRKDACEAAGFPKKWMAHRICANVIPETWVDDIDDVESMDMHGNVVPKKVTVVFGVDGIVKDRWNLKCTACSKNRPKMHGAPIQCTKGKCSKAFHVSCAKDGSEHGILFEVLREVEKEVVLLNPTPAPPAMDAANTYVPGFDAPPNPDVDDAQVLKIIKKLEVQVLCNQHNPATAAAKKASKQDRIRSQLLALAPMSRIKIRVSAGVFEVSLVRVVEETGSIEVLWDRGIKREFKWGSVVFGSIDGPVLQKPSEAAFDQAPLAAIGGIVATTFPSIAAAAAGPSSSVIGSGNQIPPTLVRQPNVWLQGPGSAPPTQNGQYPNFSPYQTQYGFGTYYPGVQLPASSGLSVTQYQYQTPYHAFATPGEQQRTTWQQPYQQTTASDQGGAATPAGGSCTPIPQSTAAGSSEGRSPVAMAPSAQSTSPPSEASATANQDNSSFQPGIPGQFTQGGTSSSGPRPVDWAKLAAMPPDEMVQYLQDNPDVREAILGSVDLRAAAASVSLSTS